MKIPEIVSSGGRLRGTILLNDQEESVNFRTPPQSLPGDLTQRTADTCFSQYMRAYHVGAVAAKSQALSDLTVVQMGEGCISHDTNDNWWAPTFSAIRLGWEHYQQGPGELWIDDVVLDTNRVGCPPAP